MARDRGQVMGPPQGTIGAIIIAGVIAYVVHNLHLNPGAVSVPWELLKYVAGAVILLFLLRGVWILKKSGDARIERKKAEVKQREGRNPDDAMTYEQEIEAKAIAYLRKIPLLRRVVRGLE